MRRKQDLELQLNHRRSVNGRKLRMLGKLKWISRKTKVRITQFHGRALHFDDPLEPFKLESDVGQNIESDGPFAPHTASNAHIWKLYMDQAKVFDDQVANVLNSDLDSLLIFVSPSFSPAVKLIYDFGSGWSVFRNPFGLPHRSSQGTSRRPPSDYKRPPPGRHPESTQFNRTTSPFRTPSFRAIPICTLDQRSLVLEPHLQLDQRPRC